MATAATILSQNSVGPVRHSLVRFSNLRGRQPELEPPCPGDFLHLNLSAGAGRSASFKCCHSTDNSRFHAAYPATCAPNAAGSLACRAAVLPGGPPPSATYLTRKSSSFAARLAFSAARNTSYSTLRSPGLSCCSWHNSPSFESINFSGFLASLRSWARDGYWTLVLWDFSPDSPEAILARQKIRTFVHQYLGIGG
jgi:hypothetical protein